MEEANTMKQYNCFHGSIENGQVYAYNEVDALTRFQRLTPNARTHRVVLVKSTKPVGTETMTTTRKLYTVIASKVAARINCLASDTLTEWEDRHENDVEALVKEHLPSGSGFDAGTTINWDRSTGERLVFNTAFHHMSEHGYYDGWTEHNVTIRPSFVHEMDIAISGKNRNDIKELIADAFLNSLRIEIES